MSQLPIPQVLLRCRSLRVGYQGRSLLPPIDLDLRQGQFWAVVGRNGSGKSTWFRTVLGLQRPVAGRTEILRPETRLAYVAQRIRFDDLYPVDAYDVVAMGRMRGSRSVLPRFTGEREAVWAALEAVGAQDVAHHNFRALSEGYKQRILLARMVASEADLAFLDEPTAAMDAVAEREAMALIHDLKERFQMAVVVVSHHLEVAKRYADQVLFLDPDAPAVVAGTPREVFTHPAFQVRYTGVELEITDA